MNKEAQKLFEESGLSDYYENIEEMLEDENHGLSDNISEIADGLVDIYYSDIYKSLPDVAKFIEQARDEGLIQGNEPIDKQIQIGQYYRNERELYDVVEEIKSLID